MLAVERSLQLQLAAVDHARQRIDADDAVHRPQRQVQVLDAVAAQECAVDGEIGAGVYCAQGGQRQWIISRGGGLLCRPARRIGPGERQQGGIKLVEMQGGIDLRALEGSVAQAALAPCAGRLQ